MKRHVITGLILIAAFAAATLHWTRTTAFGEPAATATLDLKSTPPGATILVDGKDMGKTNKAVTVSPGAHEVKLKLEGYADMTFKVTVKPGKKLAQTKKLVVATGSIKITCEVAGAAVAIDGAAKGKTVAGKPLEIKGVKVGERAVKVTHAKYETFEAKVKVEQGKAAELKVTMTPKGTVMTNSSTPSTVSTPAGGTPPPNPWINSKHQFVGSDKCKMCHKAQFDSWTASKHSKTFALLKPEEQRNKTCLACHTTTVEQAVGCESCHGPGADYKAPAIMSKAKYAADRAAQEKLAAAAGLVAAPGEAICLSCHNKNSPTFKGFDFNAYKAKIKHWQ